MEDRDRWQTRTEEVTGIMVGRISSGAYPVGRLLPSKSALAAEFGIAISTLDHVYKELKRRGLIDTKRGSGTSVIAADAGEALTLETLADRVAVLERRLDAFEQREG